MQPNLFQQHQPNYLQAMPGGFFGQSLAGYGMGVAQSHGFMPGTLFDYRNNAFESMEAFQRQAQQQQIIQQASAQQAAQTTQLIAGMAAASGRQMTPSAMHSIGSFTSAVMPFVGPGLAQSNFGRGLLDLVSQNGISPINMGIAVSNMAFDQYDPFTGRNMSPHTQTLLTTELTKALGASSNGIPISGGMQGRDLATALNYMNTNGLVPSYTDFYENAASPFRRMAVERGYLNPGDITRQNMTPTQRLFADQGMFTPDMSLSDAATAYDAEFDISNPANRNRLRAGARDFENKSSRALRSALQSASAADMAGQKAVQGRMNEYYSARRKIRDDPDTGSMRGQLLDLRSKIAGASAAELLGMIPGAYRGEGEIIDDVIDIGAHWYYGGDESRTAARYQALDKKMGVADPSSISSEDFDRRLLKLAAATGRRAGYLDAGTGKDLTAALNALKGEDYDAYGQTQFSSMSIGKKLDLIGNFSAVDRKDLLRATLITPESMLDSNIAGSDYFSATSAGKLAADAATGNRGSQARDEMFRQYVEALKGPFRENAQMLEAVNMLVNDPDIKKDKEKMMGYVNTILQGSRNQMSGSQAVRITQELTTLARTSGMDAEGTSRLSMLGGQITGETALARAYAPRVTQQLLLNNKVFAGGEGLGINDAGVYGMMNASEMSVDRARAFTDVMTSDAASAAGTVLRLRDRAGGAFGGSGGSFLNKVADQLQSGAGGAELDRFTQMSPAQQRAELQRATGRSDAAIQRELTFDKASQGRLQEGRGAEALFSSSQRAFLANDMSQVLDYMAPAGTSGIGAAITNASRSMTQLELNDLGRAGPRGIAAAVGVYENLDSVAKKRLLDEHGSERAVVNYLNNEALPYISDQYISETGRPLQGVLTEFGGGADRRTEMFDKRNQARSLLQSLFGGERSSMQAAINDVFAGKTGSITEAFTAGLGITSGASFRKVQQVDELLRKRRAVLQGAMESGDFGSATAESDKIYNEAIQILDDVRVNDATVGNKMKAMMGTLEGADSVTSSGGSGDVNLNNVTIYLGGEKIVSGASGGTKRGSKAPLNAVSE